VHVTSTNREVVATDRAPKAIGPYSQAIRAGEFVFTAGQIGFDPATGQMVDGGIAAQTRQVLENLAAVLEEAGTGLSRVVRVSVAIQNMGDFAAMNDVYAEFFPPDAAPPARMTVEVAKLPRGALVEIDAIAIA